MTRRPAAEEARTRALITQLLHQGLSDTAIHQKTGAALTTIRRRRRDLGIPRYQRPRTGTPRLRVEPDEAAILRAVAGDPPERLTPWERHAAIAVLDGRRKSSAVIAATVGCSRRTVHYARAQRRRRQAA